MDGGIFNSYAEILMSFGEISALVAEFLWCAATLLKFSRLITKFL
ncbi:hypothetical protein [Aquisalibacillus elongatus]|nr:hypothetical protein [Aquisalibacillus elongatus]